MQPAALGRFDRARPREPHDPLAGAPLGTTEELNPLGLARRIGTPTFGGPLATASGLLLHRRSRARRLSCALSTRRLAPSSGPADYPSAGIRDPDKLSLAGPPIRRDRSRRRMAKPGLRPATRWSPSPCRAPASPALRHGSAGSTGRAGASSCMPGWRQPSRSRWPRCGCGGGEGVTGCRPEQPRRTRVATSAQPVASALNHAPLCGASFLLSAMALSIAPRMADGHGRASSRQIRFGLEGYFVLAIEWRL